MIPAEFERLLPRKRDVAAVQTRGGLGIAPSIALDPVNRLGLAGLDGMTPMS